MKKTKRLFADNPHVHLDFPKLLKGHIASQVMAIFLEDDQLSHATQEALTMIDALEAVIAQASNEFFLAKNAADVHKAIKEGLVSALLSIEGAEALGDSLATFDLFYQKGVRAIGITWNRSNAFGHGLQSGEADGLTLLGKALIERMQEKHMIVDVAHLNAEGFWEVSEMVKGPFIASHANAREVLDNPRNLTDDQIRAIADHGGAIGCTFVPAFVTKDPKDCCLEAFLLHIDHIVQKGGIETCAIGSDFDGYFPEAGQVIANAGEFPVLYDALRRHGYHHSEAQKF